MPEPYVRPVTSASEPKPAWRAKWRFRVVAFVLLLVAGVLTFWGVSKVFNPTEQDPTNRGAGVVSELTVPLSTPRVA